MTPAARRLAVAIPVVIVAALLCADAIAWQIATRRLLAAYTRWQGGLPAQGWQASSDPPIRTGFPLSATLRLTNASLSQPGGVAWRADGVEAGISLLHTTALVVRPTGTQSLAAPGYGTLRFHAGDLAATAPLGAPIRQVHVAAADLAADTLAGPVGIAAAQLDADWTQAAARLTLTAGPVTLPPGRRFGLGQTITASRIALVAHGPWPHGAPLQAAKAWRDGGGRLDIAAIGLQWGTLDLTGTGQATLGADGQPDAQMSLHVVDPAAAVSALADAGAISGGAATAATAVLSLLALPARLAGHPAVLDLPLRLAGGVATLGRIPIARVPLIGSVEEPATASP